jgi:hypothetical protein
LQEEEYQRKWLQKKSTSTREIVAQVREPKGEVVAEGEYNYKRDSCTRERTKTGICTEENTRDDNSYRRRL